MIVDYTLTEVILNNISGFSELYGKIQLATSFLDIQLPQKDSSDYSQLSKSVATAFDKDVLYKIRSIILRDSTEFRTTALPRSISSVINGVRYEYSSIGEIDSDEIQNELDSLVNWYKVNTNIHPVILSSIIIFNIIEIQPYLDKNLETALATSGSILFLSGINWNIIKLSHEFIFEDLDTFYGVITEAINNGNLDSWIEYFSFVMLKSAQMLAELINHQSAGSLDLVNNTFVNLSTREKDVLLRIREDNNTNCAKIGRELKMTRQNVNVIIKGLLKKGIISKVGENTGVRYIFHKP